MNTQGELFDLVSCEYCGYEVMSCDAIVVEKQQQYHTHIYNFCNEQCANEFYLEQLRKYDGR